MSKELLKPTIDSWGIYATHNMPCCVYRDEPAVIVMGEGVFIPSHKARREGWMLVKVPKWLKWFFKRFTFPYITRSY